MDRKLFIQHLGATALLASLGVTLESCEEEEKVEPVDPDSLVMIDLSRDEFSNLNEEEGWVLHPDEDILLINVGGVISAFSSACPHASCTRDWNFIDAKFQCKCHGSEFETDGSLVKGPATEGLQRLTVTPNGDTLTVQKK